MKKQLFTLLLAGAALLPTVAPAQSGTWTNLTDSIWSDPTNWLNAIVADGAGNTADFSTVDLAADLNINLAVNRAIGNLSFSDTDGVNTPANWFITNTASTLSLVGTPTVTVNGLGATNYAQIGVPVVGTNGLTKAGAGELWFTRTNTISGGITIGAGTVSAPYFSTTQTITNQARLRLLVNGAYLGSSTVPGMFVPAGQTANLDVAVEATTSLFFNGISGGAGSALSILDKGNNSTFSVDRNWAIYGSLGTLSLVADDGEHWNCRLRHNGGGFNGNSFQFTTVNVGGVTVFNNANSGGNDTRFGALNGTTNAILNGGAAGSYARYIIGQLDTDSLWEGAMGTGNGFFLQKEGTGTLTLSGLNILFQPTANATLSRRGGETTINAGTLALINGASINRGIINVSEEIFSKVNVNTNGTYDVTGTTNNTTAPLSILSGAGKIKGDYVHDEGVLSPGADLSPRTITFLNNLTITNDPSIDPNTLLPYALVTSNSTIRFDISPSLSSGNDLINVAGQAIVDGNPDVEVNFLGGAVAGAYVLINATNGVVGSPAAWNVKWGGRGAAPSVSATANQVLLNVSLGGAGNLVWQGFTNEVWDVNTTSNWLNGAQADKFFQLDAVTFNESAPLQSAITLSTIVTPTSVTVSNDATPYTISGSGQIGGGGGLTKRGTGLLTLTTANTYSGGTTVSEAGTLDIGSTATALGSGALNLNDGTFRYLLASSSFTVNTPVNFGADTTNILQMDGAGNTVLGGNFTGPGSTRVLLQTDAAPKPLDFAGDNTGFTGTMQFNGNIVLRFRNTNSAGTSAIRWELGGLGATLGSLASDAARTFELGSVNGGPNDRLGGHESGGGGAGSHVTWVIGALNQNMLFEGIIRNGNQNSGSNVTAVTKVGAGTLVLSGANTYSGPTVISNGTISLTTSLSLPNTSTVDIESTGKLDLNYSGISYLQRLVINGVTQPDGTYGATGSGASTIDNAHFSGTGVLYVGAPPQTSLGSTYNGTQITLDWPANQGWRLQAQTNSLTTGITGTWFDVAGAVPPATVDVNVVNETVFYRLVYP